MVSAGGGAGLRVRATSHRGIECEAYPCVRQTKKIVVMPSSARSTVIIEPEPREYACWTPEFWLNSV
jgi:hypothetical protein